MITESFIFLDGIGARTERRWWVEGITDWSHFLGAEKVEGICGRRKCHYDRLLREARKELFSLNSSYFISKMPSAEMWRLYEFFKEDAIFLDIETTGMGKENDLTVVGLFDGTATKTMVRGMNLNYRVLKEELEKYKLLVTFNGGTFDIPYLQKRYPGLVPPLPHLDLRTLCARLGHSGGLKAIEKEFGIARREIITKLQGGDACTLWRMYYGSGDEHYLKLLIEYNEEDTINLKKIADVCTKKMRCRLLGK